MQLTKETGVPIVYPGIDDDRSTLSLLHEIGQELTSILDQEELFKRIAELVKRLIDFQHLCLYLWDEDSQSLVNHVSLRFGDFSQIGEAVPLGRGVCGAAADLRKPLRIPDVRKDPRFIDCNGQIRSELAVPLTFKDRLIGVINLESVHLDAFSAAHEKIMATLASSIAISLENARLYRDLRKKEERMENDLDMAREVQTGLLPDHSPYMEGLEIGRIYRPAKTLGGDFFDFLRCGDDRLKIAVGDVSGKSTAAALYASLAIGILRTQMASGPCSPAAILKLMNSNLALPNLSGRFLAMMVATFDRPVDIVRIANAGLPTPLLLRDGRVESIDVAGIPLGLFPNTTYEEMSIPLQRGDVLVMASDGLQESMDARERELGSGGLSRELIRLSHRNAQDIAQGLLEASLRHSGGDSPLEDDRTAVVLRMS